MTHHKRKSLILIHHLIASNEFDYRVWVWYHRLNVIWCLLTRDRRLYYLNSSWVYSLGILVYRSIIFLERRPWYCILISCWLNWTYLISIISVLLNSMLRCSRISSYLLPSKVCHFLLSTALDWYCPFEHTSLSHFFLFSLYLLFLLFLLLLLYLWPVIEFFVY